MERMSSDSEMETFLSGNLDQVPIMTDKPSVVLHKVQRCLCIDDDLLVRTDPRSFQSLGTQLFILVRDQVHASGELINACSFSAEVEDANFRIWYTTVEPRFWIWLERENVSYTDQGWQ